MIKEVFVSPEIVKLLKEKGFPFKSLGREGTKEFWCTQQMVMMWLREVHHIHVCPEYKAFFQEKPKKIYHHWCCKIVGIDKYFKRGIQDVDVLDSDYFYFHDARAYHDSYEEACGECIRFALENLIIK